MNKLKEILPGFIVCLVIGLIAQLIAKFFPSIGAALFAIGIGMIAGNTFLNKDIFNIGTKFSESKLLEYSIVLTGLTLHLVDIMGIGLNGVSFIAIQMTLTIGACYFIGKKLGFRKKFSLLMCAGNAVCGSSAIGTVAPIIDADSKDKGISITIVNVTGTILMVTLPIIAGILYNHDTMRTAGLIGGTLQSIGQVIASASLVNSDVVEFATIFKIVRIIFIVIVAVVFSKMNLEDNQPLFAKKDGLTAKIKAKVPWFVIGFFIFSVINSTGYVPAMISSSAKLISSQFEIIALAAIGMRVKFKDLVKEGPKAMLYGCFTGFSQIIFAIILIMLLFS
ncbi:MAG: putative sulfate exporter family transporter [Coprobacillus sp.]